MRLHHDQQEGEKTTRECYLQALHKERQEPSAALGLYRAAGKRNTELSSSVFVMALIGPPAASIFVAALPAVGLQYGDIASAVIIAYLGFAPAATLSVLRRGPRTKSPAWDVTLSLLFSGPFFMFEQFLVLVTAAFGVLLWLGPLLILLLLLHDFGWSATQSPGLLLALRLFFATAGVYGLLAVLADMWYSDLWPPISGLRYMFAGLRSNVAGVWSYASVLLMTHAFLALRTHYLGLAINPVAEAGIAGCTSGIALALGLGRFPRSPSWQALIDLGITRCFVRARDWASARAVTRKMFTEDTCRRLNSKNEKRLCGLLSKHLLELTEAIRVGYRPKALDALLLEADDELHKAPHDLSSWSLAARKHRELQNQPETEEALTSAVARAKLDPSALLRAYFFAGFVFLAWWVIRNA